MTLSSLLLGAVVAAQAPGPLLTQSPTATCLPEERLSVFEVGRTVGTVCPGDMAAAGMTVAVSPVAASSTWPV